MSAAEFLDAIQWPAMVFTIAASWLVGSTSPARRKVAFWLFLASNVLWIAWGWSDHAYALIVLQLALAALNIRGALKASASLDGEGVRRGVADQGRDRTRRLASS